ncbi:MAG: type II secretion system F family protein, partial [Anaerolineae bacterium]
ILERAGWLVAKITPKNAGRKKPRVVTGRQVTAQALRFFFQDMASSIRAGLPASRALSVYAKGARGPLGLVMTQVLEDLNAGMSLADAMGRHGKVFKPLLVEIIRAGEMSGTADVAFARCAGYLASEISTRQKVRSALVYPCLLIVLGVGAGAYLLVAVLPKITAAMAELGAQLPPLTKAVIGASDFLRFHGAKLLGAVGAGLCLAGLLLRVPAIARGRDWLLLHLPVVGRIVRSNASARFCRVLSETLNSGLPVQTGLELAVKAVGNRYMEERLGSCFVQVLGGRGLAASLESADVLPYLSVQTMKAAEEAGNLGPSLCEIARAHEEEAETLTKGALSLIEPALIILVACGVGILAAAIVLPIYTMVGQIGA